MNRGDQAVYNGYEVCLWPLEYVGITGTPSSANHVVSGVSNSGLYDNGWYQSQIRHLYAPVTLELIATYNDGAHTQQWASVDPVWLPGFNDPQYITFICSHSDNLYYTQVGTIIQQGTHFYDTGTYGLGTGAHVHLGLCIGRRTNAFPTGYNAYVGGNIWYSPNPPNTIADYFYILPTDIIRNTGGYTFTTYEGKITHLFNKALLYYLLVKKKKKGVRAYVTT